MQSIQAFKPSPIFRLTILMAVGILLSYCLGYSDYWLYGMLVSMCSLILFLFFLNRIKKYRSRGWYGIGVSIFFLLLGAWSLQQTFHKQNVTWITYEKGYRGFLIEPPIEKENSYAVLVKVESKQVLLYLPKNEDIATWKSSEELLFYTTIQPPRNRGNPNEFDYASYLYLRGITGTAWVNEGCWVKGDHKRELTLVQHALKMRQKIIESYRSWGITDKNLAVLSALTVGEKEDITHEIRSSYAAAGLSHLLALSGLHVGTLWGCIAFLFRRLGNRLVVRLLRFILILSLLWFFAFIGGLTPSLVRAVIMCSLMEIAALRGDRVYSIHTLSIAAWLMLLYNPLYLFDVAFQLSFLAVLSILLLVPVFKSLFYKASGWKCYLLQAVSVSLAAQLGTAPISIYYFSIFPSYFLLSNLAVLLLLPLLFAGVAFSFLFSFSSSIQYPLVQGLDKGLTLLNNITYSVGTWPYSSLQINDFSVLNVLFFYLLLSWSLTYFYTPNWRSAQRWISLTLLVIVVSIVELYSFRIKDSSPYILFYNQRNCSAIHLVEGNNSLLVTNASDSILQKFKYIDQTHWKKENLKPQIIPLYSDSCTLSTIEGVMEWRGKRICMIADKRWTNRYVENYQLPIDYLYICKGFVGRLDSLQNIFQIGTVVLDASLSRYSVNSLAAMCDSLQLSYVDIANVGSYKVLLTP